MEKQWRCSGESDAVSESKFDCQPWTAKENERTSGFMRASGG
jgi:hypothetical protein